MQTFNLNHLALSVKNVDAAVAFYQKVLQLKEIKNTASSSKTRWLEFEDGRQLHLIPRPQEEIKMTKSVHFALSTTNLEAVAQHLLKQGVPFYDWLDEPNKIYTRQDGIKQLYFQDPDNYWIEINNDKL